MARRKPAVSPADRRRRDAASLEDGLADGLEALEALDLSRISGADGLLRAMARTAFNGRRLGEAAEVLEAMLRDEDCAVILTLSGAMTVAKMGLLITEMIERGWVQCVVSTGALMTHGLVELAGMSHFKARPDLDDRALFAKGYNRIYDTYELERNLDTLGELLAECFADQGEDRVGSWQLLRTIGERLAPTGRRGVLTAAAARGVPIYIPALSDSEMGLDFAAWHLGRCLARGDAPEDLDAALARLRTPFDPFIDLAHYTRFVLQAPRLGIFTIGGGVPRNWAQQASPFVDHVHRSLGLSAELNRIRYALRICPEPPHWGGLSGCTYSEGVSWGKFVPPEEGGRFAEVYSDATIAWPLLAKGVAERLDREGVRVQSPGLDIEGYGVASDE